MLELNITEAAARVELINRIYLCVCVAEFEVWLLVGVDFLIDHTQ
jgi:hypothetical protein